MEEVLSESELDERYPKHERVYKYLKRFEQAREDFQWVDKGMRARRQVDSPPIPWRRDGDSSLRCSFWTGTQRAWNQDVIYIRGHVYPVVLYFWELRYGRPENSGILTGSQKVVVRPICCHYSKVGICVNPYHSELRFARAATKRSQHIRAAVEDLWRETRLSARQIAASYALPERRVYELVRGIKRSA